MAIGSLQEIVLDSSNPVALARFWQALIGGDVDIDGDDWVVLDGDEEGFYLAFQTASDRRPGTTRVHWNVVVDDLDRAIDESEQLGARKVGGVVDEDDIGPYQVMVDPEDNEFWLIAE